jgi:ferric-dicitrate binding protein FerR (iron transport regulator)
VIHRKGLAPNALTLSALLFALVAGGLSPQVWAQTVAGSITAITGSGTITRGSTTFPAAYGTQVDVGDRLVTAAATSLTVTLSDSSQIELTDSSTLTIDQNTVKAGGARASTRLSLLSGLVRSLVSTTPGTPPNYEVHTPNAVASARGTYYDVDHETGAHDDKYKDCTEFTHVAVYKGDVDVYNPTNPSSPTVNVKEGQTVTVPCGSGPIFSGAPAAGVGPWSGTEWGAIGVLGLAGAGAIAVGTYGAAAGFGSSHNVTSRPFTGTQ